MPSRHPALPAGPLPQVNSSTIRGLSLGGNALSGTLPYSYQAAPLLTFLDISGNRLTGPLAAAPPAAGSTPASGPWGTAMPSLRCASTAALRLPASMARPAECLPLHGTQSILPLA